MLFIEASSIHSLRGKGIVPDLYYVSNWINKQNEQFRILIMDRLGENLEQLFNQ